MQKINLQSILRSYSNIISNDFGTNTKCFAKLNIENCDIQHDLFRIEYLNILYLSSQKKYPNLNQFSKTRNILEKHKHETLYKKHKIAEV